MDIGVIESRYDFGKEKTREEHIDEDLSDALCHHWRKQRSFGKDEPEEETYEADK